MGGQKQIIGHHVRPRVQSVTSAATVTPDADNDDLVEVTAQAEDITLANPSGVANPGQAILVRIKDDGTSRAITYDSDYRAIGVTLPTATTISKTVYLGFIYNDADALWDCIGVMTQA